MDITKVHTPERLEGETQNEYRYRQQLSKRLATHQPLVFNRGTFFGPASTSKQQLNNNRYTLAKKKGLSGKVLKAPSKGGTK